MKELLRQLGWRVGVVVVILTCVWLSLWFGWDTFLVKFGLFSLDWLSALGATVIASLIFAAIYLLKEDFREGG